MNMQSVKRTAEISSRDKAPTARHVRAWANGPGNEPRNNYQALKARNRINRVRLFRPFRAKMFFWGI